MVLYSISLTSLPAESYLVVDCSGGLGVGVGLSLIIIAGCSGSSSGIFFGGGIVVKASLIPWSVVAGR